MAISLFKHNETAYNAAFLLMKKARLQSFSISIYENLLSGLNLTSTIRIRKYAGLCNEIIGGVVQ